MATTTEPQSRRRPSSGPPAEQRVVLNGVDWATYQRLATADRPGVRLTYDRGVLELMSPGPLHEMRSNLLGRLIEIITVELGIPAVAYGATRWEREDAGRGLEPDECYLLTAEKIAADGRDSDDAADHPAPDLAIEVELTRSAVRKLELYATLGVSEVWRYADQRPMILQLRPDATYEERPESRFLPITADEIRHWVAEVDSTDQTAWARQLIAWVRAELAPRCRGPAR